MSPPPRMKRRGESLSATAVVFRIRSSTGLSRQVSTRPDAMSLASSSTPTRAADGYSLSSGPTAKDSHPAVPPSWMVPAGAKIWVFMASMLSTGMPRSSARIEDRIRFSKILSTGANPDCLPLPRTKYHM